MKRQIITTKDGSKSLYLPDLYENYHSDHGALQESMHVFIQSGWKEVSLDNVKVLEIGFGTGLNAIITLIAGVEDSKTVEYTGLEAYPVTMEEVDSLEYNQLEGVSDYYDEFKKMHSVKWDESIAITDTFTLTKVKQKMEDFTPEKEGFDLVYFDAFGPRAQPFMWTIDVLQKMYDALSTNGVFVTYCAKGDVRRSLIALGFEVEKIPGPPGKREMLRARKK